MKDFEFPLTKTKLSDTKQKFNLEDPVERRKYFELKAGPEIERLKDYLRSGTFVGFLLGKKNSGKGTYSKLFMEAVGSEHVTHVSIGDVVRHAEQRLRGDQRPQFLEQLKRRYRGFLTLDEIVDRILGRSTKTLLPTETILALLEIEIDNLERKALFIDGFPRHLDQVSLSLFFRALMGYRDDPDFFVFIDVPESVIDERMKYRVVCPVCQTPRNTRLLRTKLIGYDQEKNEYYLKCDNASCQHARLVPKEGDHLGIKSIRERLEIDDKIMHTLISLQGVPKIFLRNSVPVDQAAEYVDDYEITPGYQYKYNTKSQSVSVKEEPWIIKDDNGQPSYSLLPAPIGVALIKQAAQVLEL